MSGAVNINDYPGEKDIDRYWAAQVDVLDPASPNYGMEIYFPPRARHCDYSGLNEKGE